VGGSVKSFESSSTWKNTISSNDAKKVQEEKTDLDEEYELGPWSDWYWSEEYRFLYRGRKDRNGMLSSFFFFFRVNPHQSL
jgi:hypothetical protein